MAGERATRPLTDFSALFTIDTMQNVASPFRDSKVESIFACYPEKVRAGFLELRELIFETAKTTPGVGMIVETLKWGQPAYLTPESKSGSTIRLGLSKHGGFALYTHCQTTIMSDFQSIFPGDFTYERNRTVHFEDGRNLPLEQIKLLIVSALTYHLK